MFPPKVVYRRKSLAKNPLFLEKNPNGQVPMLEWTEDGTPRRLAESNAILIYLAEQQQHKASLLPRDDYQRALTYQWLFFEQYSHEPAIAVRRANIVFDRPCPDERMQQLLDKGHKALSVMETQLAQTQSFLVGPDMTIADMALFAYTHVAHEGGYDVKGMYPNISAWLERVRQSPGFVGMEVLEPEETGWEERQGRR